jgi:ABC-type Zn uptake system ZnuABC Zn-binding protein ZnuA
MKKTVLLLIFSLLICMFSGCQVQAERADIAATTLPVYQFTQMLCQGTGLTVTRLVTESVSCLHDYSLNVRQVRSAEAAELVVISGAGLEEFMDDLLEGKNVIDSSADIPLLEGAHEHDHGHEESSHRDHHHEEDPHIWLSPANAKIMAQNIAAGLARQYPQHTAVFEHNLASLLEDLDVLQSYGEQQLSSLSCRELITFHDGFAYLADSFQLTILEAVEEESGSEASAVELIHLIEEVNHHKLPAIFTETLGSVSAAQTIAVETGASVYELDMIMHGESYFDAMYHNIDTLKGALG